jgi:hypothetical protein
MVAVRMLSKVLDENSEQTKGYRNAPTLTYIRYTATQLPDVLSHSSANESLVSTGLSLTGPGSSPHIPDASFTPSARTYGRFCSVVTGVGFGVFTGNIPGGALAPLRAFGLREVVRGGVPPSGGAERVEAEARDI